MAGSTCATGRCSAALSVLWGGSFFFNGVVLRELPPFTLVLLRVALAALILLPLLRAYRLPFPKGISGWRPFFAVALFNNVLPFSLIVIGQTYHSERACLDPQCHDAAVHRGRDGGGRRGETDRPTRCGRDRRPDRRRHPAWRRLDLDSGQGIGILLCLAAAFSYGIAALVARRTLADSPPLATATFQLLASSLMMAVIAGLVERPWQLPMPGLTTWLAVLGLAALSTALAYIVFFQVLRRSGATNVMLVTLLLPVTAILLGAFVLGEHIALREIFGALVIGSALLLIDGRVLRLFRRRPSTPQANR